MLPQLIEIWTNTSKGIGIILLTVSMTENKIKALKKRGAVVLAILVEKQWLILHTELDTKPRLVTVTPQCPWLGGPGTDGSWTWGGWGGVTAQAHMSLVCVPPFRSGLGESPRRGRPFVCDR